jgi:DNA-binding NtrC family response regulator
MKCKLLIVDDEEKMVKYLSRRLVFRGFDVRTAFSGREALLLIKDSPFDVVLLDILMPDMDGIETLKKIKEITPATEVILLTGHQSAEYNSEGKKWGAFDYILKPFDLNDLISKIHMATRYRYREQDLAVAHGERQEVDPFD